MIAFIENIIVNFLIILEIIIFTKIKYCFSKHIFLSILLSCNILLRSFKFQNNFIIFILFVNIIIYLLFKPKEMIKYFKYIWYFILLYSEFIGLVISITLLLNFKINNLYIRIILYVLSFGISYILNNFTWKIWQNNLLNDKLSYNLYLPKYNAKFKLYLDTGNFLKDKSGIYEIIILNENKYLKKISEKNILSNLEEITINANTINSSSELKGYIFSNLVVENNKKQKFFFHKAIIIFTKSNIIGNKYDGLLGIDTYINKLKGVNL